MNQSVHLQKTTPKEGLPEVYFRHKPPVSQIIEPTHELIFNNLPVAVFTLDSTLKIRQCNAAAENAIGFRRTDILGRSCRDIFQGGICGPDCPLLLHGNKGRTQHAAETTITHIDGETIRVQMHCTAIHIPSGEVGGVSITLLDSTERKPPPKVEVNSAAMLAHDMKSSLVGLHGLSRRLLKSEVGDNEKKRNDYLHIIYKEAASLEKLISGFIEYQCKKDQEQKLSRSIISLEGVIRDIFASYREIAIEDAVSLELCIDEPLSPIEADADQLRRVFSNLLANALKFSRKGGVITLAVKEEERHIAVSVTDEGIGIDSSDLPHIFDCFRRGKSVGSIKGYGIGLAVVKSIVEAHNGKISVSSTPAKGSCFCIHLPKLL